MTCIFAAGTEGKAQTVEERNEERDGPRQEDKDKEPDDAHNNVPHLVSSGGVFYLEWKLNLRSVDNGAP